MTSSAQNPRELIVFVDETGDEKLTDPNFPIFGLGGCAVLTENYETEITDPWRALKVQHFGGLETPMHAAKLRATPSQIGALAQFFRAARIYRIAAVVNPSTSVNTAGWSLHDVTAGMLLRNIAAILSRAPASTVRMVFEHSQRGERLVRAFFDRVKVGEGHAAVPLNWSHLTKDALEPGLEVADFVIHTAGAQAREAHRGASTLRKDFKCVFQDAGKHLTECATITKFALQHNPAGTINAILIDPRSVPVDDDK